MEDVIKDETFVEVLLKQREATRSYSSDVLVIKLKKVLCNITGDILYTVSADNIEHKKWYQDLKMYHKVYTSRAWAIKKYYSLQFEEVNIYV